MRRVTHISHKVPAAVLIFNNFFFAKTYERDTVPLLVKILLANIFWKKNPFVSGGKIVLDGGYVEN